MNLKKLGRLRSNPGGRVRDQRRRPLLGSRTGRGGSDRDPPDSIAMVCSALNYAVRLDALSFGM